MRKDQSWSVTCARASMCKVARVWDAHTERTHGAWAPARWASGTSYTRVAHRAHEWHVCTPDLTPQTRHPDLTFRHSVSTACADDQYRMCRQSVPHVQTMRHCSTPMCRPCMHSVRTACADNEAPQHPDQLSWSQKHPRAGTGKSRPAGCCRSCCSQSLPPRSPRIQGCPSACKRGRAGTPRRAPTCTHVRACVRACLRACVHGCVCTCSYWQRHTCMCAPACVLP